MYRACTGQGMYRAGHVQGMYRACTGHVQGRACTGQGMYKAGHVQGRACTGQGSTGHIQGRAGPTSYWIVDSYKLRFSRLIRKFKMNEPLRRR